MPPSLWYMRNRFWKVTVASVWFSSSTLTFSLASMAWCRPSDERRTRLVDEDRVDLVDDRVVQLALHVPLDRILHIIAEIIEAELVVGAVGDVGAVGELLLAVVLAVDDGADGEAEELVDAAHP